MSAPAFQERAGLPPPPSPEWRLAPVPEEAHVRELSFELKLPEALCRVLLARGIEDGETARSFLRPLLEHLHPPELLTDVRTATRRILQAVDSDETILVHGDYDVDGVCSAALLTLWLRELGGRVEAFVPHRLQDGYDLGEAGLEVVERVGASLLVTCDSGIAAHAAVARARARGVDVIVTDHHTPAPTLPPALAVLNPRRSDCSYPDKDLAGVGVAFKLCQMLAQERGRPLEDLLGYLDLVALATIADLVPLKGENRVLVRFGLRVLNRPSRPGLAALKQVVGLGDGEIDAGKVGFVLAPRINAAGRMGAAADALELLLTDDRSEASRLARILDDLNTERREEDRRTLEEALRKLAHTFEPDAHFGVVVEGEGWHPGVIGIVASRVVERIHRPTVLIAVDGDAGRGSARSVPEVDLYGAVRDASQHLSRYGGHRQAAGMDLETSRIPAFREAFNRNVREQLGGRHSRPRVRGDAPLALTEVTDELHHFLRYLGPFGMGNPRPVFWARDVAVAGAPRVVGRGHLKLSLGRGGTRLDAIGFGLAERVTPDRLDSGPVDLLFQLRENEYRGVRTLQARLVDLRVGGDR